MKQSKQLSIILLISILLAVVACYACRAPHLEAPYSNPPMNFQDSDLVGTWEAHYMEWGIDKLILRADGTFRQIYHDYIEEDYVYETPWNEWSIEQFSDGRAWIHLQGARFYHEGIKVAERDGMHPLGPEDQPDYWGESGPPPFSFYDPVAEESLHMVGELVLNIRSDSSGQLVLLHMFTDSDGGFAIIGGGAQEFRRVETP